MLVIVLANSCLCSFDLFVTLKIEFKTRFKIQLKLKAVSYFVTISQLIKEHLLIDSQY